MVSKSERDESFTKEVLTSAKCWWGQVRCNIKKGHWIWQVECHWGYVPKYIYIEAVGAKARLLWTGKSQK